MDHKEETTYVMEVRGLLTYDTTSRSSSTSSLQVQRSWTICILPVPPLPQNHQEWFTLKIKWNLSIKLFCAACSSFKVGGGKEQRHSKSFSCAAHQLCSSPAVLLLRKSFWGGDLSLCHDSLYSSRSFQESVPTQPPCKNTWSRSNFNRESLLK